MCLRVHVVRYQLSHLRLSEVPELLESKLQAPALDSSLSSLVELLIWNLYVVMWLRNGPSTILLLFTWWKTFSSFLPRLCAASMWKIPIAWPNEQEREQLCGSGTTIGLEKGIGNTWKRIYISLSVTHARTHTHTYTHSLALCLSKKRKNYYDHFE